jgi:hypothetical protein
MLLAVVFGTVTIADEWAKQKNWSRKFSAENLTRISRSTQESTP